MPGSCRPRRSGGSPWVRRCLCCAGGRVTCQRSDLSAKAGLSTAPCWNRTKRIETEGVTQGDTVRIDPVAIGFTETVIVRLTLEIHTDHMLEAFGQALQDIPEVLEAYPISGAYGHCIHIAARDYEGLLRERRYRMPGMHHGESRFALRRLQK